MSRILKIETISRTRAQIIPDEGEPFCLSVRDVRRLGLKEDMELTGDLSAVLADLVRKECLRKCGSLLGARDYSRQRLLDKLTEAGFPSSAAESALEELEKAGYVNDERYAADFIRAHLGDRSRRRIEADLRQRGIPDRAVRAAFEELDTDPAREEEAQIRKWLEKKGRPDRDPDFRVRQKALAALARKGYGMDAVRRAFSDAEDLS